MNEPIDLERIEAAIRDGGVAAPGGWHLEPGFALAVLRELYALRATPQPEYGERAS